MTSESVIEAPILAIRGTEAIPRPDQLAVEEPLEIRIAGASDGLLSGQPLSLTMRTPGHDAELALGFLVGEGVLSHPGQVLDIVARSNVVTVTLARDVHFDWTRLERHFYATSSCGVCGKTSLAAVRTLPGPPPIKSGPLFQAETITRLPSILRESQAAFDQTGGLHAAALFDVSGDLLCVREDVGRHNALDKLIGAQFLAGALPLNRRLLLVSGRASFELMQKAVMAGLPVLAAVGAPSSLAVELAQEFDVTLLGFVREGRFNVYAAPWRLRDIRE